MGSIIFPSHLADPFVARSEENDEDEREEEGERPCNAPLAEDNAEIFGRPGKYHLYSKVSNVRS